MPGPYGRNVRPPNDYPSRDGRPVGETELHRDLLFGLIDQLARRYESNPDVYVSGNLLIYYEEGRERERVAPDVFVVFGVPKGTRDNYLMWEEGKGPDVVIELTSRKTRKEDTVTKRELYLNRLGVREFFLFDPRSDYLSPSLQGFRREKDRLRPIREKDGRLPSKLLGLHIGRDGTQLRLWDPVTGQPVFTTQERIRQSEEQLIRLRAEGRISELSCENLLLRREVERLQAGIRDATEG